MVLAFPFMHFQSYNSNAPVPGPGAHSQQRPLQEHVPEGGPSRAHPGHLPVRRPRDRRPGLLPGRLGGAAAGPWQGRQVLPRRHHILGHRVRRGQPARGVHQDIQVRALDTQERYVDGAFRENLEFRVQNS